ncbi:GDP-mannose 4,6-dehydratase [bacterium]|nr:GDP-mannose 4,6-dehydratase [bacterium]
MRVLITGAAGQDGTILATQLAREGHDVLGLIKPGTSQERLLRYVPEIQLAEIDLENLEGLRDVVSQFLPTHIYNFGGFTAPGESWDHQDEVRRVNVDAVAELLGAASRLRTPARFFQASSSHIFEGTDRSPQDESFELSPHSPYAESKAEALQLVRQARERGLFAVSGILYNHESPLRTDHFVTRKVTRAAARIAAGLQETLELGDVEVARDWGWAPDYVRGMRLMLEADSAQDYVLATGISHRLSFFVEKAFAAAGVSNWKERVVTSRAHNRPVDTNKMVGDSRSAYINLGWRHTVDFDSIACRMVEFDEQLLVDDEALWPIPSP